MSEAFDRFRKSNFFGDAFSAIHDGLDVPALTALDGDDRAKAEVLLLKALPEGRAIVGLGAMRSKKAEAPLRKLLGSKGIAVEVAVALYKISGDTSGVKSIIDTLKDQRNHWSRRMDAAIALRQFRTQQVSDALLDALHDPEGLVRYHASNSLLILYGQMEENDVHTTPEISIRAMREAERAAAVNVLRRLAKDGTIVGT